MEPKKWYLSKSIWVGVVTLVWGVLEFTGVVSTGLSPESMATILGVVIVVLRALTKSEVTWK